MALYCGLRTSNNLANFFFVCVAEQDLCNPGWPQSSEHGLLRLHTALVLAGGCDQAAQEATVYRLLNHISIQGQTFCSQKIFFYYFSHPLSPLSSTTIAPFLCFTLNKIPHFLRVSLQTSSCLSCSRLHLPLYESICQSLQTSAMPYPVVVPPLAVRAEVYSVYTVGFWHTCSLKFPSLGHSSPYAPSLHSHGSVLISQATLWLEGARVLRVKALIELNTVSLSIITNLTSYQSYTT